MLEVITGCMYSGKTEEFIERVQALQSEGKDVIVLKPVQDTRYSKNDVVSHSGFHVKGIAIDEAAEIWDYVEDCDVLAIDEVQFFGWEVAEILDEIANTGVYILATGLDLDFKGKPFGIIPELMSYADKVVKKQAKCAVCGETATRSQRLVNGKPASIDDPIVVVDENITYEPRCRTHHILRT